MLPKHEKYEMYYAVYPDGEKSEDFYNLTRAKEHTKNLSSVDSTMLFNGVLNDHAFV